MAGIPKLLTSVVLTIQNQWNTSCITRAVLIFYAVFQSIIQVHIFLTKVVV